MLGFNDAVNDLLGSLVIRRVEPQGDVFDAAGAACGEMLQEPDMFEEFKKFLSEYVQEHDKLPPNHPAIEQLMNFNSIDEIEKMLEMNFDYCDDCLLKMYRKFAGGGSNPGCPCGGE